MGSILGIWWEHLEKLMGTHWEQTRKQKILPPLPTPHFSLASWTFYFQNDSSPFSTWTSIIINSWGYLFCFILISWVCLTIPTFLFCNEPIWLAHHKKKLKLWRLPKIKVSMERWNASPFDPPSFFSFFLILLWAKHMGLKRDAIGNTLGEQILGTWWKPIGNLKGTYWEQRKNEKNPHPNENLAILAITETSAHHAFRTSEKTGLKSYNSPKLRESWWE